MKRYFTVREPAVKPALDPIPRAGLIPRDTICELVRIEPGAVLLMMQRSLST